MTCERLPIVSYAWTEGDRLPVIGIVLPGGELVASYTITLELERPDGSTLSKAVADLGGSSGEVAWAAADLQSGRLQRCQIRRTDGASLPQTIGAFLINVRGKVGA